MIFKKLSWISLAILATSAVFASKLPVAEMADSLNTRWDQAPVERESDTRAAISLNGLWLFQPGNPENPRSMPVEEWGWTWVPGSWHRAPDWNLPGRVVHGEGAVWEEFLASDNAWPVGWYEREITVPTDWKGRKVEVDFERLSTQARVWLDGELVGAVDGQSGTVDLTKLVRFGQPQILRVQVLAVPPDRPSLFIQGELPEEVFIQPARLNEFGIVWNVSLRSLPTVGVLDDIQLETSVSDKRFTVTGFWDGPVQDAEAAVLSVHIRDLNNKRLIAWEEIVDLTPAEGGRHFFEQSWDWMPDRLWDLHDPYLLVANIQIQSGQRADSREVRFGFREFELSGRNFYLNEIPIRLAPLPLLDLPASGKVIEQVVKGKKTLGANLLLLRDDDSAEFYIDVADRLGMLVFMELPEIRDFLFRGDWDEGRDQWELEMRESVQQWINHPSVAMWWSGFNLFAHGDDQNPRRIGQSEHLWIPHEEWQDRIRIGLEAMDLIRAADPTRGVYAHNGSVVGDLQTTNTYLNFIPLQEREEWLSQWAEEGDLAFMAVEFGTPLDCTFMQGKLTGGWTTRDRGAVNSAPMVTEYGAIYFGPEAYRLEEQEYKEHIRNSHVDGFVHNNWGRGFQLINEAPIHQQIQELFQTNTLRSWRTWGLTGGMNLWSFQSHGWRYRGWRRAIDPVDLGDFEPGTRGLFLKEIARPTYYNFMPGGYERLPGGQALMDNLSPVLAWIAGSQDRGFTDKQHNFYAGGTLEKQIVLLNDKRYPVPFEGTWEFFLNGQPLSEGSFSETLHPAENHFIPILCKLPEWKTNQILSGEIRLQVKAGERDLTDVFSFRVHGTPEGKVSTNRQFFLLEGDGATKEALVLLGLDLPDWKPGKTGVIVVGRGVLDADPEMLRKMEPWVKNGGILWIQSPSVGWLQNMAGFRTAAHISRRVFPVANPEVAFADLSEDDLRDWSGEGTLLEPYPIKPMNPVRYSERPYRGWRWGNRGSVASTTIEKPHHAGWRPLFEAEFDLAYSPLLELPYGKGLVLLSTFDIEGRVGDDPAVDRLVRKMVSYIDQWQANDESRGKAYLYGNEQTREMLTRLGVIFADESHKDEASVIILGRNHGQNDATVRQWLKEGKAVVYLRRAQFPSFSKLEWNTPADHFGSLDPPDWPELEALSIADFHFRAPYPMWTVGGEGSAADGLVGREQYGDGVLLAVAFDPDWIDADAQQFLRLTRWRHQRNLAQILSGAGARLLLDKQIFQQQPLPLGHMPLLDGWKAKSTLLLEGAESPNQPHTDDGLSEDDKRILSGKDTEGWVSYDIPAAINAIVPEWKGKNGVFWIEREVQIPEEWIGSDLVLVTPPIDDFDHTYWNGTLIGSDSSPNAYQTPRRYTIPGELVRDTDSRLLIRIFDAYGIGGITSREYPFELRLKDAKNLGWYHPDYRLDFAYGDDAYRYYRW